MINLRPLADRIAVRPLPGSGMIGLLHIPDATQSTRNQTFCRAEVLAHGPKVKLALAGRKVIISEYFGDEIESYPESQRVGRERDIVAVETLGGLYPAGDRILLERIEREVVRGGIFIPENVTVQQYEGRVVAAGIDCRDVKVGDRVMVPKNLLVRVSLDGRDYLLIDEPAVLAIYEPDQT